MEELNEKVVASRPPKTGAGPPRTKVVCGAAVDRDLPTFSSKVKTDDLFGKMIPVQLVNPAWLRKFPKQAKWMIDVPLDQLPKRFHTCTTVPLEFPEEVAPSPLQSEAEAIVEENQDGGEHRLVEGSPAISDGDYMDAPAPLVWNVPISALNETSDHIRPPSYK